VTELPNELGILGEKIKIINGNICVEMSSWIKALSLNA
jgi:hypothetical protein